MGESHSDTVNMNAASVDAKVVADVSGRC